MRLLSSITSYCILSVYLLSAALLSNVVVASPMHISSSSNKDMRLSLSWRIPGEQQFQYSRPGSEDFTAQDRLSLFITGDKFTDGLEPQVVSQDSTNARHIEIKQVAVPHTDNRRISIPFTGRDGVTAHFVNEDFFQKHYAVIRNVAQLCTQTNALMKGKGEKYRNVQMSGDPNLQHPINDLDWINTVFLYLTLIDQPEGNVPVLDPQELRVKGWGEEFTEFTRVRGLQ
ncbi:hypothetical protein F5050DRAFT_643862 [Lentinula boryana]|uniref:Uncharacterized protein n=1 Tax=Lentinula boryana TaxID=40481 RepID=A0ABQ8Q5M1_9AGAR|nr:hypothetical protein F5050DRAFT_643862 [Lentinula boryana]